MLTLANTPVQAAALQERVFVERAGKVRFGYKNRVTSNGSARFNMDGTNALLAQLGMEVIDPNAPFDLTPASYQGDWMAWSASDVNAANYSIVRIAPTYAGSTTGYSCLDNTGAAFTCTLTLDPATGGFTLTEASGVTTGTLGMASGVVASTFQPTTGASATILGRRR